MKISSRVLAIGVSGLLAIGVAGVVLADNPPGGGHDNGGTVQDAGRHGHPRIRAARGLLRNAAETIGIEARALAGELKSGKTIAEVATEHNVDPQLVIDNAVAAANARIDQAAADGKIPADRVDDLKERVAERIAKAVNEGHPHRGQQNH